MRRSSARRTACATVLTCLAVGLTAGASGAHAHGNEATFHDVKGAEAPTLDVTATTDGSRVEVHLDTSHFTWATSTSVANFTPGEGAARAYLDTNRAARVFSPDFTLDTRAWNLAPGEHTLTVTLTGSDLVPYAANGEEVEVTVPITVTAAATDIPTIEAPTGSSFSVSGARDPFGGWVLTPDLQGFEGASPRLEFALDGKPWAQSSGEAIHVYPDAIVGKEWIDKIPPPVITVTAVDASGARFTADGSPAEIAFSAPTSLDAATWSWKSHASQAPLLWMSAALVAICVFAVWALRRLRR